MNKKCTHKIHQNFPNMQIPPSQSHTQPFPLLLTSGIFSLKYLMLKIRLNILITNRLRPIWLQRDGSFATKIISIRRFGIAFPNTAILYLHRETKMLLPAKIVENTSANNLVDGAAGLNLRHLPASNPQETRKEKKTDIYQTNPT